MKNSDFNRLLMSRLADTSSRMRKKGDEYSTGADRLANFKRSAELQRVKPIEAALGCFSKHMVSIVDMVKSDREYPVEIWDEKIGDAVCYLVLIEALAKEGR